MADIQYRWACDTVFPLIDEFRNLFDYVPCIPVNRDNADKVMYLSGIIKECIDNKDDSSYIMTVFKDYEDYFDTKVYIPEPDGGKIEIMSYINKSFTYKIDLLSLFYKGVSSSTLEMIISDINLSNSVFN